MKVPERFVKVPDYSMPLIGWRIWRIHPGGSRLMAILDSSGWPVRRPIEARCRKKAPDRVKHPFHLRGARELPIPPFYSCRCGIYALQTSEQLIHHYFHVPLDMLWAYGPVALWGKIIRHTAGYRAQYAYPLALFIDPPELSLRRADREKIARKTATSITRRYGIPTTLMELDTRADRVVKVNPGMTPWLKTQQNLFSVTGGSLVDRWPKRMVQQFKTAAKLYTGREAQGGILESLL